MPPFHPFGQAHGVAHLISQGGLIFIADEICGCGDDGFLTNLRIAGASPAERERRNDVLARDLVTEDVVDSTLVYRHAAGPGDITESCGSGA